MELTQEEARHLIKHLTEMVLWSDDPLHKCTMIESSLLRKVTEEYPYATEAVRIEMEEERQALIEANQKEREAN